MVAFDVGLKNLAFARVRWDPADPLGTWRVVDWRVQGVAHRTRGETVLSLHLILRGVAAIRPADTVVIEQQMRGVMVAVSYAIFAQALELTSEAGRSDAAVRFVSAKDKLSPDILTALCPIAVDPRTAVGGKRPRHSYDDNKADAVEVAARLTTALPGRFDGALAAAYLAACKRDDLADALLHALAYVLRGVALGGAAEAEAKRKRLAVMTLGEGRAPGDDGAGDDGDSADEGAA